MEEMKLDACESQSEVEDNEKKIRPHFHMSMVVRQ
jgi:hypothetical protein